MNNLSQAMQQCLSEDVPHAGLWCNASWDGYSCWPQTPANTTVSLPCPRTFHGLEVTIYTGTERAQRLCNETGAWHTGQQCNGCYVECVRVLEQQIYEYMYANETLLEPRHDTIAMVCVYIYFYGAMLSLVLLLGTFAIFCYFKALHCSRISIHKNLILSFILRYLISVVYYEPFLTGRFHHSYRRVPWLCKLLQAVWQYSSLANMFWMLVEGVFLHDRVAVSIFHTSTPFFFFYSLGWGLPLLCSLVWGVCMGLLNQDACWLGYYSMPHIWIIIGPIILALVVNTVFMVNIMRVLVTRMRANHTEELEQFRKTVKATIILFPLLGLSNVIFFCNINHESENAYRVINAVLQSSQGIFVTVIYCFCNNEVQRAIRKRWVRYQSSREANKYSSQRSSRGTSVSSQKATRFSTVCSSRRLARSTCQDTEAAVVQNLLHKVTDPEPTPLCATSPCLSPALTQPLHVPRDTTRDRSRDNSCDRSRNSSCDRSCDRVSSLPCDSGRQRETQPRNSLPLPQCSRRRNDADVVTLHNNDDVMTSADLGDVRKDPQSLQPLLHLSLK